MDWRSYLLRPHPRTPSGDRERAAAGFEKFVRYTSSWARPAAEEDGGNFQTWQTEHGPPSHSIPPQLLAKAAARIDAEKGADLRERLFQAYFGDNLDITDSATMRVLWRESDLADGEFESMDDPALLQQVLDEHNEALALGANGVPAIMLMGTDAVITGAHPRALYRRWIDRTLERRGESRPPCVLW